MQLAYRFQYPMNTLPGIYNLANDMHKSNICPEYEQLVMAKNGIKKEGKWVRKMCEYDLEEYHRDD